MSLILKSIPSSDQTQIQKLQSNKALRITKLKESTQESICRAAEYYAQMDFHQNNTSMHSGYYHKQCTVLQRFPLPKPLNYER